MLRLVLGQVHKIRPVRTYGTHEQSFWPCLDICSDREPWLPYTSEVLYWHKNKHLGARPVNLKDMIRLRAMSAQCHGSTHDIRQEKSKGNDDIRMYTIARPLPMEEHIDLECTSWNSGLRSKRGIVLRESVQP